MWKRLTGGSGVATSTVARNTEPDIHISVVPSSLYRSNRTSGNAQLQWVGAGEQIQAGGYELRNPLVYVSSGAPSSDEASCIDLSLPVGPLKRAIGRELDYWPRYSELTQDQRATYLNWLTHKHQREAPEMGYVFLYFYGLERRAVIDREDIPLIQEEVLRLLRQYGENRSFFGYASSFLAYISAYDPIASIRSSTLNALCVRYANRMHQEILSIGLAWLAHHGVPLPPSFAYEVARQDQRSKNSVVVERTSEEFEALFAKKYRAQYDSGLTLRVSKRQRKIEYIPASPSFVYAAANGRIPEISIPNVFGLSSQFSGLIDIWNTCIEDLKPLSRQRAKGTEPRSREEYEALPAELRAEVEHPDKPAWDALFDRYTDDRGRCEVPIAALASLIGVSERPKLTVRQSKDMVDTALMMGIYIVPSPHTILRPYRWDEPVALVRAKEGSSGHVERYYLAAALMLEMGTAMAAADGTVEKVEMLHVSEVINRMFRFRADEARRLGAYRSLLIRHPPKLTGLGKRLRTILQPEELAGLGEFLVGVAASNGVIDAGERSALKKAYKALGVPQNQLAELLAALEGPNDEPPVVQRAAQNDVGEAIPPREDAPAPGLQLNRDVLETIIADTAQVAVLIGKAMGELEQTDDELPSEEEPSDTDSGTRTESQFDLSELEPRYHAFVCRLVERDFWNQSDFAEVAQDLNLMIAGAVDAVNLWADENFDDYLIEEAEGGYTIQLNILEAGE